MPREIKFQTVYTRDEDGNKVSIPAQMGEITDDVKAMIASKMEYVRVTAKYVNPDWEIQDDDGNKLTYLQLKALFDDPSVYLYLMSSGGVYIPSYDIAGGTNPAIEFSSTYIYHNHELETYHNQTSRVIINSENVVNIMTVENETIDLKADDLTDWETGVTPSAYPTADAVVNYVGDQLKDIATSVDRIESDTNNPDGYRVYLPVEPGGFNSDGTLNDNYTRQLRTVGYVTPSDLDIINITLSTGYHAYMVVYDENETPRRVSLPGDFVFTQDNFYQYKHVRFMIYSADVRIPDGDRTVFDNVFEMRYKSNVRHLLDKIPVISPTQPDKTGVLWVNTSEDTTDPAVRWDVEQTLTDDQKAQARENIGAINGVSIAGTALTPDADGNVEIPISSNAQAGLVKSYPEWGGFGIKINPNGYLYISSADNNAIDAKSDLYKPLVPAAIDRAVRAGLISNTQITDVDKPLICNTIGAEHYNEYKLIEAYTPEQDEAKVYKRSEPDGTSYDYYGLMIVVQRPAGIAHTSYNSITISDSSGNTLRNELGMVSDASSSARMATMHLIRDGNLCILTRTTFAGTNDNPQCAVQSGSNYDIRVMNNYARSFGIGFGRVKEIYFDKLYAGQTYYIYGAK